MHVLEQARLRDHLKSRALVMITRTCFVNYLTVNSYLGAQKASHIRLFRPCFHPQVQFGEKIGSNLDHFDQHQRVSERFLLLSGTSKIEQINDFDWFK